MPDEVQRFDLFDADAAAAGAQLDADNLDADNTADGELDDEFDADDDDFEPVADRYRTNTRCDVHSLEMEFPFCPACGHRTVRYE